MWLTVLVKPKFESCGTSNFGVNQSGEKLFVFVYCLRDMISLAIQIKGKIQLLPVLSLHAMIDASNGFGKQYS